MICEQFTTLPSPNPMSFRALLSPFSLTPKAPSSAISPSRRPFASDANHASAFPSLLRLHLPSHGPRLRVFGLPPRSSGERGGGKAWADVKSEPYEVSDSISEPLKFEDVVSNVVVEEEDLDNVGPWWESFPKRWVIVLLCFSAFLLCNMDRVSSFHFLAAYVV